MPDTRTPAEWARITEDARRSARFKAARERIRKMVEAVPPFTDEQLSQLVYELRGDDDDGR